MTPRSSLHSYPTSKEDAFSAQPGVETEQTMSASYRLSYTDIDFLTREELRPVRLQYSRLLAIDSRPVGWLRREDEQRPKGSRRRRGIQHHYSVGSHRGRIDFSPRKCGTVHRFDCKQENFWLCEIVHRRRDSRAGSFPGRPDAFRNYFVLHFIAEIAHDRVQRNSPQSKIGCKPPIHPGSRTLPRTDSAFGRCGHGESRRPTLPL